MDLQNSYNTQNPRLRERDLDKILHFGASVSMNPSGDEFTDRYMFTDGFAVKNIILKCFSDAQDDFSACLFKILPPYSYDVQKQMNAKIQNPDLIEAGLFFLIMQCKKFKCFKIAQPQIKTMKKVQWTFWKS